MASLACLAVGRLFGPGDLSEGCQSLLHMVSLSSVGLARGSSRGHLRILMSSMIGRVLMHKRFFKPLLAPYLTKVPLAKASHTATSRLKRG